MNLPLADAAGNAERVTCLIVDDLQENLLALAALIDHPGVELLQARSGEEALELLLLHDVALALLDVQMPEMDGFELAELMRGSDRTRHIPIIFLTAGLSDERRQFKGYEAGAVDFLQKPIQSFVLKSKLEVFFQLHRQKLQLAQELKERNRTLQLQEMFTAVLGHDLRDPLSAMIFAATMLQKSADDEVRNAAELIAATGWRMNRLIGDLLDLARIRLAGGILVDRRAMDLAVLLQRTQQEYRLHNPERMLQIETAGDIAGDWDEDRLAQVLSNLVGNAVKHGETSGPIVIRADGTRPHQVLLSVSNDGAIDARVAERLFDPFGEGRRSGRNQGLGLGLYIVQQIVRAHGGDIGVNGSEAGRTSVEVSLPRYAASR
jgi:two-component system sensor histidine kinase/response regulator